MSNKLAKSIERIVRISSKGLGEIQINVDKILWGNPSPPKDKKSSARYGNKPAREPKSYTTKTVPPPSARVDPTKLTTGTGIGLPPGVPATPNVATYQFQSVSGPDDTPPDNLQDPRFSTRDQPDKTINYREVPTKPQKPKPGQRLLQTGLFSTLDALNSVDLCDVVTYAYSNVNIKRKPRPDRSTWRPDQVAFYTLQDQAKLVTTFIDKYTAYPNVFIGSYLGVGPNAVPPQQAVSQSNAPIEGGTPVQKYNMYYLLKSIGEVFSFNTNTTGSLFTSQDAILLQEIPKLGSNLNFVNDFLGDVNKYADFNQISTPELLYLQNKIGKLRAICENIQNLDIKSAANLIGNFLGVDIRSQIQKLSEFVDITKIIPTLKEINNGIRSFIKMANQVQKVIQTGQFIIKLAILFYKIFKFVFLFFKSLAIPLIFGTSGTQITLQDIASKAKDEGDGVVRVLKSINALLGVATGLVRYLLVNASELLRRLDTLLVGLQACDAFKDSDILNELNQTRQALNGLVDELSIYIINFDSKTDPDTALFGTYQIRIIDEQVIEQSIKNKRRRGVALDQYGAIVTQSDLTFATNPEVIIGEVKQKLVSLGLVRPDLGTIDGDALVTVSESLDYLDNNDILQNDLNISRTEVDLPDNVDETKGLGLNAFVNNLRGGRRLRKRTRKALADNLRQTSAQIKKTDSTGQFTQTANRQLRQANQLDIANLKDQIKEWQTELALALTQGPVGYAVAENRRQKIITANRRILELQRAG